MSDISKHLGQIVKYESTYNAGLLVKELRQTNRTEQGITSEFVGKDVWNIYEVNFLRDNGLPVNGIGKLVYSSDSEYIVESKSLKLYFFSYNMEKLGDTREQAAKKLTEQVIADLTELLGTKVSFTFTPTNEKNIKEFEPFTQYESIDDLDFTGVSFDIVNEDPSLLRVVDYKGVQKFTTSSFRSNCKVTSQPDLADIYVMIQGEKTIDPISLMQYLVSFRNENHFHEECIETIYDRLYKALSPEVLIVTGRFTRRGGIDINPHRVNDERWLNTLFIDPTTTLVKTLRQ